MNKSQKVKVDAIKFRNRMIEYGLTQAQLAQKAGCSQFTVNRTLKDGAACFAPLVKMCRALDLSMEEVADVHGYCVKDERKDIDKKIAELRSAIAYRPGIDEDKVVITINV